MATWERPYWQKALMNDNNERKLVVESCNTYNEFLYAYPQKSNESLPIWENCQSHAYSSWIQSLTDGDGIQLTRMWQKQTVRTEFATQLHSYCGNLVFLCIKGSLTSCTSWPLWCMNVDVTSSNETGFLSSWYCWKWHAIFRICLSLDSYLIIFMNTRCMLIRRREVSFWSAIDRRLICNWIRCDGSDCTVVVFVAQCPNDFTEWPINFGQDLRAKQISGNEPWDRSIHWSGAILSFGKTPIW